MYSNLLAVGGYNPSVLLLDPASGEQAGVLQGAASSAAISVTAWQEERDVLLGESEGRELLAVGDADGGVNLVHVKLDEMVGGQPCLSALYGGCDKHAVGSIAATLAFTFSRLDLTKIDLLSSHSQIWTHEALTQMSSLHGHAGLCCNECCSIPCLQHKVVCDLLNMLSTIWTMSISYLMWNHVLRSIGTGQVQHQSVGTLQSPWCLRPEHLQMVLHRIALHCIASCSWHMKIGWHPPLVLSLLLSC